jgi:hypothetical protein
MSENYYYLKMRKILKQQQEAREEQSYSSGIYALTAGYSYQGNGSYTPGRTE